MLDREGAAAAAAAARVRVVEGEARTLEGGDVIDLHAAQVLHAEGVDEEPEPEPPTSRWTLFSAAMCGRKDPGPSANAWSTTAAGPRSIKELAEELSGRYHGEPLVVLRDGTRSSLPLADDGMIPQRLGVPLDRVAYAQALQRLQARNIIDAQGRERQRLAAGDTQQNGRRSGRSSNPAHFRVTGPS